MAYEMTAAGIPAVNVVTRSRVVSGITVKTGNPTGTRREVRVSSTAANEVGGSTAAGKAVAAAAEVRAATAAAEVTTTSAAAVSATTTTSAAVSATAATATVALGSSRHRRPSSDRQGGQHTEGPGKNSSMFRRHGFLHSVAGPRLNGPRGIRTLQLIRRCVAAFVQVRFRTACIWLLEFLFSSLGVPAWNPP